MSSTKSLKHQRTYEDIKPPYKRPRRTGPSKAVRMSLQKSISTSLRNKGLGV